MNCAYRLIWNEDLNAWVVAPEIASARGKRGQVKRSAAALMLTLAIGAHTALAAELATTALPGGGQVSAGQATISSTGAAMTINQGSQRAIINWQNFDIGSQASVNFQQPNSSAVTLNRAGGPAASRIEGQLTANGQVFLINPSGVLFGSGARVNVGGLVASTLNIRDADFLSGNYVFSGNGGSITNQGQITAAPGGYLAFISPSITNNGTISAPQGTVAMGAGERVRLNFAGDRLVGLDVSAGTIDTLITNNQAIRAEGGAILLTAAGAEAVTRSVINNSGVLEASSLTQDGGRIVLTAGNDINLGAGSTVAVDGKKGGEITVQAQTGTLLADGQLTARGTGEKGGTVKLLGRQVGLVNAALVDASGTTGGGTVLVGGDYQGGNGDIANARATYIAPDASIKANALLQGDGGKVIVWADDVTRFYGTVSAGGAGIGGNGGFVETSGKAVLDASGNVSALGAGGGNAGTWLLDPYDITIQTAGSNTNVTATPNFTSTGNSAIVTTGSIQTALNAGTSVTVTTGAGGAQAGNITVANAISKTAGANASLTLNAINNIVFNAGANVSATVGQLALTLNAGGSITNPATINTNGGLLTFNATGATIQSGGVSGTGGVTKNGTGTLTLSGANTYTGTTTINAGTLRYGVNNAIASGAVVVNNGGTYDLNNFSDTIGALTVNSGATGGTVTTGTGTLTLGGNVTSTGGAANATISGNLALGGNRTFTTTNAADGLTVSAVISGVNTLTKAGAGTLTLSGANTYTGTTTISAGTLVAASNTALGTTAAGTAVASGATLALPGGITVGAETLSLNGSGVGTNGALRNLSGNNAWGGTVTLAGTTEIQSDAGTLTLGAANSVTGTNRALTIDGAGNTAINGTITTGTGSLTKNGTGTLTLSGANTYTGTTTINAGTLRYGVNNAIASGAVVVNNGGTYDLNNFSDTIGALTVNSGATGGTVTTGTGTLTLGGNVTSTGGAANATISGNLALGGNRTFTTTNAADGLTVSAVISGVNTLTKAGAGTLTLSGANTYTGTTTISAGTLVAASNTALGTTAAGTAVASGATLALPGGITVGAETLSLNGSGVGTNGALRNLSGNNAWGGTVTLAGTTEIQSDAGTLTLGAANSVTGTNRALTIDGAGNTAINGTITTGTGSLTKNGTGTLTLSGANTYTGTTTINAGTLRYGVNNAIASGAVVVNNGGTYDLNNFSDTIGALTVNSGATGGTVTTGTGTLTLGGNVTSTGGAANATISGNLALGGNRTFTTTNAADGLTVSAVISGVNTLTKAGAGTLTLSGANTYTGTTTISAGTLTAVGGSAIADTSQVTLGNTAGATLNLANSEIIGNLSGGGTTGGNVTLGANTLTVNEAAATTYSGVISGTGGLVKQGAATLTLSGANTYTGATTINAGTVALGAANRIADTSAVTVASGATFNLANFAETVGSLAGAGNVTLGSATLTAGANNTSTTFSGVASGTGGLTKVGTGTLTLSGANTYSGTTTINAGTLVAANNTALGTVAGGTTVANGATLALQGGITVGAEALNISGTGVSGDGALRNLGGNNTLGGTVTLAGDAEIQSDAGILTLNAANSVTGATRGLTIDGAGNTTINGTITTTSGTLTKNGAGTLTLSGANTYTGITTVNAGTLAVTANNALGTTAAGITVASGATLDFRNVAYATTEAVTLNGGTLATSIGTSSFAGPVTLGANSNVDVGGTQLTLSGAIGGTGFGIAKQGSGTLVLSGANTYTGTTTINAGTLTASGGNAIADTSAVTLANVAGATLNLANNETIGNLSGGGAANGNVTLGSNTLTVNQTAPTIYAGSISGSGGLTKTGTDTLTLAGANSYTGVTDINAGTLVAANAAALGGTGGGTNVGSSARLRIDGVAVGAEPVTLNGPGLFGTGAITSTGTASLAGPVTLAGNAVIAPNSGSTLTLSGPVNGAFGLTTGGFGTLNLNGAVGGVTPLAFLTTVATGATSATGIGTSVRTTGDQTYNSPTTLASGVVLQSTAGSLSAPGAVVASAGPVSLRAAGNVVFQNATNDFGTVAINAGANAALRDSNAIDLGGSAIGGSLSLLSGGAVSDSGAISVGGATTINAGAASDITLDNANNFAGNVGIVAGRNVRLNDVNDLTLDISSFGTLTVTAAGTVALAGTLTASGTGDAIVLSGSRFVNSAGAGALSAPNGHWLVWSSNPNPFGGATPDNRGGLAYDFKQYNAFFGVTPPAQATGNGFLYTLAPTITPGLTGTVSKVYDTTTTAPLTAANFTPTTGVDGDVIAMTGTGAYDNPNVAGSPTKLVTASGIAATVTSSIAEGSKPVYGYMLTSTTASANIGEITPAPLTITGNTTSNVYTAAAQTNGYTTSGLLTGNGDSVTSVATLGSGTNVGTYADNLTSATGTGLTNYTIGYVNGSLTITPAPLTITGDTSSSLYTSNLQTNTFSTTGLLGSDSVTSVATLASGTNVGTYADSLTSATGSGLTNYTIGYVNGSLTITPAPLTITANDASRTVNTLNPQFSATYTGFVGGETPAMLNGVLAFATPATLTSPVGIYPITPYGQSSGNYTITYLDGDLTVYGAPVITPTLPREVVSQQAIGAQYTDPTMSTDVPTGLYYVFDDDHDSKIEKVPASMVRVVGSGIRLRN